MAVAAATVLVAQDQLPIPTFRAEANYVRVDAFPTKDGAPVLDRRSQYVAWARVLGAEYDQLRRDAKRGRKTVLDDYGATNPAEFFAVATECFFEKPLAMRRKHPELYEELKEYYRQDPAEFARGDDLR